MNEDKQPYYFSDSELKALATLFRQCNPLSDDLYPFSIFVQQYIYQNLTIAEAECLYTV